MLADLSRDLLKVCLFVGFVSGMGLGCSKKSEPPPPAAEAPSASAASLPSAPPSGVAPAISPQIIAGRLAAETASRTPTDPSVEKVFEAFVKTGAKLFDSTQHLASPYSAKYCVEAHSDLGVYTDVCEFADEASAKKGMDASTKAFATVPNRTLLLNKKTLLTLRDSTPGPKSAEQVKTLAATFKAL
jgi:hypothetical protein